MPSAKPDKNEINLLRKKRGLFKPPSNLFSGLFFKCRSGLKDGYITPERVQRLLTFLDNNAKVSAIFPNNLLLRLLRASLMHNERSSEIEPVLLEFIAKLYLGMHLEERAPVGTTLSLGTDQNVMVHSISVESDPDLVRPPDNAQYFLAGLIKSINPLFIDAWELIYDSMLANITIDDRFVGFTGDFKEFTRKTCFEEVRKLGGVPSDPNFFLDYLFVSEEAYERRNISNILSSAIHCRRVYGNPLILRENDWLKVVSSE